MYKYYLNGEKPNLNYNTQEDLEYLEVKEKKKQ